MYGLFSKPPNLRVVPFTNGLFTNYLLCRVILHWSKWRSARSLSQIPKKVKPWNKMECFVSNIWQRVQSLKLTNQPLKIGKSPKKTNFCLPSLWIFRCKLAVNFMEGIYVIWSQVDKLWQDIFEIAVCFLCGPLPVRVTTRITTVFVLVGDSRDELLRSSRYIMSPRWWQRSGWLVGSLTNSWHLYLCNYITSCRHTQDYRRSRIGTGLVRHVYIWMYQVGTCIYDTQFAVVPLYPIYIDILSKAIGFLLLGNIWDSNMNPVGNSCIFSFKRWRGTVWKLRLTGLPEHSI